jgi:molybdopterin biosynthesis enzyme
VLYVDFIITSGGRPEDKYDFVQEAFTTLGMDVKRSTLLGKIGKPSIFGKID